jgi:hypothetical protein
MLGDDKQLELFSGDNVGRGMDSEDKTEWYEFQHQLKNFATKNFMTFGSQNINRLKYSMQGQAALKEGLFESWNGTKNVSWNGDPDSVRLMIRHKRPMGVNEARFRQVESLFLETAEGERYKLPFRNLAGGRAMVEHVRQGGRPYDMRGQHIANMVEELNVLSRFRRASHGRVFEGDTANLVTQTNEYHATMNRALKGLSSSRGYNTYFESWNPADITEQDVIIEDIKTLFVQETIDSRIEQALPILARIQQQGTAMKEANIFEAWAENLLEGTWATPNTPEQQQELIALLSQELPVGADATNATEQLYSLVGDDILFDQLQDLAEQDANADCRNLVIARIKDMSNKGFEDFEPVLDALRSEQLAPATVAPEAPVAAAPAPAEVPPPPVAEQDDEEYSVDGGMNNELLQDGMLGAVLGGAAGAALTKSPGGAMTGAKLGSAAQDAFGEEETDGSCNYTAEGEHCPEHGLMECGSMYEDEQDTIGRLRELSGMNMSQQVVDEETKQRDKFYYQRNDIWRVMDGDEVVDEYKPARYEVVGAKKLLAQYDDDNIDVTHVISPMGVVTYLYGKPEDDMDESMTEGMTEGMEDSPVAGAITRRILMQRADLLSKYGPEKVTAAIDEVADFVGDVEEIGSSDVSGWIKQVEQSLGNMAEEVAVTTGNPPLEETFQDELNDLKRLLGEGWKSELAGGTLGGVGGTVAGSALGALATGSPIGAAIGGVVGGAAGGTGGAMLGREMSKEEQLNEIAPLLAAGARAVIPLLAKVGPKLGQMASGAGKAGAQVAGKTAAGIGRGTADVAKSAAQSAAQNAGQIGLGVGAYQAITDVADKMVGGVGEVYRDAGQAASAIAQAVGGAIDGKTIAELAGAAVKYAIPVGILLAVLYGGKKLIDQVMAEGLAGAAIGGAIAGASGGLGMAPLGALAGHAIGDTLGSTTSNKGSPAQVKETTSLQGQYGHSGKLQKFDETEQDVLHRLRELSGMIRS